MRANGRQLDEGRREDDESRRAADHRLPTIMPFHCGRRCRSAQDQAVFLDQALLGTS